MDVASLESYDGISEKQIIKRVLAGAKNEYRALVVAHQEKIYSIIMREVGDAQIAREITQETFLKAYVSLSTFRFEARFSTWLIRIALNLTHSYFSSRQFKERLRTVRLDHKKYSDTPMEEKTDRYDEQAIERLKIVVGMLRPKLRDVFVLCGFEQKTYAETARILGIPVGTVRSRLNKARLQVKQLYFEA